MKCINKRISHCEKKLARLLFNFGVVTTIDNYCEQVPSVALHLQQLTTPAVQRWSCPVHKSGGLMPSRTGGHVNICTSHLKPEYLASRASRGGYECVGRINTADFLIAFHSNYDSVLLTFQFQDKFLVGGEGRANYC